MKISIITVHDIGNNFGSTLQSCALCEFLRRNGYEAQLIDYMPDYKSLSGKLRSLLINALFFPHWLERNRRFGFYYRHHAILSRRYHSFKELKKDPPLSDLYMVGSDQVWNPSFPCGHDAVYYLEFIADAPKMAYSASLGRPFSPDEMATLIARVRSFKHIGVRENHSKEQFAASGRADAEFVLDPVFLFDADYYSVHEQPVPFDRFLLVYAINPDPLLEEAAKNIARKRGLKIISIGGFSRKCECDLFMRSAGPIDFLNLIRKADFFLTSSFHGVALALILECQFAVIQPRINSLRLENILSVAGLTGQAINSAADLDKIGEIDFTEVRKRLAPHIVRSKEFLLNSVNSFQQEKMK